MKLNRTHIISWVNHKGGCGKTTGAVSIAAGLAKEGFEVRIVDSDEQCNTTDTFFNRDDLAREEKYTLVDAYLKKRPMTSIVLGFDDNRFESRLSVIPSHRGLSSVQHHLEAQLQATVANENYSDLDADDLRKEHRFRFKNSVDSLRGSCDFILIDTPPSLGFLMTSSLIASDWYVIPVFPSRYDLEGLERLTTNAKKIQERYNPRLRLLGVLLGRFDARTKLDPQVREQLSKIFDRHMFETVINVSVKTREASFHRQTIYEHAPRDKASEQYLSVTREILNRIQMDEDERVLEEEDQQEVNRG